MNICGIIQVHEVRLFIELCTYTHSTILNILRECMIHIFFSILPHEHLWSPTSYQVQQVRMPMYVQV